MRVSEPNEDSYRVGEVGPATIAVVADGHGSDRCPRAGVGSQLAVDVVFDTLGAGWEAPLDSIADTVVRRWRDAVDLDLTTSPPPISMAAADDPHARYLLYGSTVIGVAVNGDRLRLIQIGDGDILLGRAGEPRARRPVPPSTASAPRETTSLCQPDAARVARVGEHDLGRTPVDVVLVATDGLDAAFADDSWHDATMQDLLGRLPQLDRASLDTTVARWCAAPAATGGDDTTLTLLVRNQLLTNNQQAENP